MKLWKVVFGVWVFFWVLFFVRGLVKGEFERFKKYAFVSTEQKRSYILGEELETFLRTCEKRIPESDTYKIIGDLDDHNRFRMVYYLYPRLQSDKPDYLLKIYTENSQYLLQHVK
ncbi:hypothetical protein OAA99_00660 [Omnitrophica bacterium]|nr:hypothetical protein [Candidatus Omnitrophota bacterium]